MRTVAIVGDSRGIGAALREQLLEAGTRVIGVSRTGVQREGGEHPNYQSLVFDAVEHPCDLSGFADQLDGLVYCPGTIKLKPLRGLKPEQFQDDFKINVLGAVQTLKANHALLKAGAWTVRSQVWCFSARSPFKPAWPSTRASRRPRALWKAL